MTSDQQSSQDTARLAERLHQHVRAAASLRLEILAFERDREEALRADTRIIYCVDTNIIQLYLQPRSVGPKSGERGAGYGVVFPEDSDETARVLGAALSRYIFHSLASSSYGDFQLPLILLPGHDAEARGIYDATSRSLGTENQAITDQRKNLLNLLQSTFNVPGKNYNNLNEKALFEAIFGAALEANQIKRFNYLITNSCIARLSVVSPAIIGLFQDADSRAACQRALSAPADLHEQIEESALRIGWEKRISNQNPARAPWRMRPDIAALARLELINRRLVRLNARLVLITGDQALHKAAHAYSSSRDDTAPFDHIYLRHPRAFLASTHILARGETAAGGGSSIGSDLVVNWLDALLARYYREYDAPEPEVLGRIAFPKDRDIPAQIRAAADSDGRVVDEIKTEWDAHITLIRKQHSTVSGIAQGELQRILGPAHLKSHASVMQEFDNLLIRDSEETWQSFFAAMTHAGFDISQSDISKNGIRSRNVPPIMFDSFHGTRDFVHSALSAPGGTDLRSKLIDALPKIDADDDGVGYAKMLAYATLHAFDGNWYVAGILADRAIGIAERLLRERFSAKQQPTSLAAPSRTRDPRQSITGREAYYFSAVAKRYCVRRVEDLERVGYLLDQAEVALMQDLLRVPPPDVDDNRFRAERAATALTRVLLEFFEGNVNELRSDRSELNSLALRFASIAESAGRKAEANAHPLRRVNLIVQHNCLVNAFMLCALLDEFSQDGPKQLEKTQKEDSRPDYNSIYKSFQINAKNLTEDPKIKWPETRLVRAITIFSSARLSELSAKSRLSLKFQIDEFRRDISDLDRKHFVMPYDRRRFLFLMDKSEQLLRRRSLE